METNYLGLFKNLMLNAGGDVLNVFLDVLAILVIIVIGAFLIVLIADLIISSFDDHEGIIFNRKKKSKKVEEKSGEGNVDDSEILTPTVTSYYEEMQKIENQTENTETKPAEIVSVDYDKALEEQKMIESKMGIQQPIIESPQQPELIEEASTSEEDMLTEAIATVTKEALEQINDEKLKAEEQNQEELDKENQEKLDREAELRKQEELEEQKLLEEDKIRQELQNNINAQLNKQAEEEKAKQKEKVEKEKAEKEKNQKELKKLRDDIFSLKRTAFNDMQEVMEENAKNEIERNKIEFNKQIKAKLAKLEEMQNTQIDTQEKTELNKYKQVALDKHNELEQVKNEKEELEKELAELKKQNTENAQAQPYYTQEYYQNKLEELQTELKDVQKELKANKREFVPLQRIKKSYDRDQEKLRRKEAIVAKQKIAIYGVKSSANIDPKKKEKLDADVKLLNQLKESVFQCDQVLKQNKDRYPVLEKSNILLTKSYNRLVGEIENVNAALDWYNDNANND